MGLAQSTSYRFGEAVPDNRAPAGELSAGEAVSGGGGGDVAGGKEDERRAVSPGQPRGETRVRAEGETRPSFSRSESSSTESSVEESFFGWRCKSEEEDVRRGEGSAAFHQQPQSGVSDEEGRYSLASTIPLEDQMDQLEQPSGSTRPATNTLDPSEYKAMLEDFQQFGFPDMQAGMSNLSKFSNASGVSTVAQSQQDDGAVHPGSMSGSGGTTGGRSVGTRRSGESQSTATRKGAGSGRGSLSMSDEGQGQGQGKGQDAYDAYDGYDACEGYHQAERREGSTSARSSLTLERADARANRSSFEAFQRALKVQEKQQRRRQKVIEQEQSQRSSNVFRASQNVQDYEEYPKDVEFLMALGVPKELCRDAWMLTVLPADSPAPAHMLSKLWNRSMEDTHACMSSLTDLGVMSVALMGGQQWGLPREAFMQQLHLHLMQERPIVSFHRCLVNGYAREAWGKRAALMSKSSGGRPLTTAGREGQGDGFDDAVSGEHPVPDANEFDWERFHQGERHHLDLEREGAEWDQEGPHYLIHDGEMLSSLLMCVEDDGYIVTNLVYHLVGARLDGVVRRLLLNPAWLERKLMLSMTAASADASLIVADFRRYLMLYADNDVKLVLEALQLSMSALKQNLVPGLLQTQVTGRLIAAPLIVREPWMQVKYHASAMSMGAGMNMGMHMPMSSLSPIKGKEHVVALPVLNPCLDQAGGIQRSCLKCGHDIQPSRVSGSSMSSMGSFGSLGSTGSAVSKPSSTAGGSSVSISGYVSVSHVAVVPTMAGNMEAVSAASDGSLTIWDLEIGDSVNVIWAHKGPITGLAATSDGSLIVSASTDGMIRAYDLQNGNLLRSFGTPNKAVSHMVLDPHGRFVVTAERGELVTWDLVSARAVHTRQINSQVTCLVLSPCSKYAIAGTEDGDVLGVSVDTGAASFFLKGHTAAVTQIVASPGCKRVYSVSHDRDLRVWYGVKSSNPSTPSSDSMTNSGSIVSLHLTKDRKTALCGLDTGNTAVWDVDSNTLKVVLEGGHAGPVTCITMSHDERSVLTAGYDGTTIVWSLEGDFLSVLEGHSGAITCLHTLSRNGFAITGSEDGSVRVWDSKATESHTAHWHNGLVRALSCGRSGIAVTVGDDCIARVWNAGLGEHLRSYLKHKSSIRWCAQSDDGYRILTASPDRQISVWDPRTGNMLYGVPAKSGSRVKTFSASADLTTAVSCLFDSTVECWDLVSGRVSWVIQTSRQWTGQQRAAGHSSAVNEVVMTNDGRLVVTASKDCTARIWDVANKTCKHVLVGHEDSVVGIVLEQASRTLVTFSLDHSLIVWDLESGNRISRAKFKTPITRAALSINGKVAIALTNGCVNLIDLHSGDIREIPRLHRADITGITFSRDGSLLISSSWDCSMKVIDLARGCVRGVAVLDSPITCFSLDKESKHLCAGTDRGTVAFIDMGALL